MINGESLFAEASHYLLAKMKMTRGVIILGESLFALTPVLWNTPKVAIAVEPPMRL